MRTLCVTSGKGGVGKTTLSINLGIALARAGRKVLLLDGDLGLANLNVMLGIIPQYTIHDVIRGRRSLAQIVIPTPYGLDLIAGANGIAELADLGEDERARVMRDLEGLNGYDVLIIDTGAGIGDTVVRFVLAADDVLVVTTPHPTSLTDAYGIIKTILAQEAKPLKLLVNCAPSPADPSHTDQLGKSLEAFASTGTGQPVDVLIKTQVEPTLFVDGKAVRYVARNGQVEATTFAAGEVLHRDPGAVPQVDQLERLREDLFRLVGRGGVDVVVEKGLDLGGEDHEGRGVDLGPRLRAVSVGEGLRLRGGHEVSSGV